MEGPHPADCDRASEVSFSLEDEAALEPGEAQQLSDSLKEIIQSEDVKPKLQFIMSNPSFSMVTVQCEDSGIMWETSSSRCSTPWASEASTTSDVFSMESSSVGSPPGKVIFIMDENKIRRKKVFKSSNRSLLPSHLKGDLGHRKNGPSECKVAESEKKEYPASGTKLIAPEALSNHVNTSNVNHNLPGTGEALANAPVLAKPPSTEETMVHVPTVAKPVSTESAPQKVKPPPKGSVLSRIQKFNAVSEPPKPPPRRSRGKVPAVPFVAKGELPKGSEKSVDKNKKCASESQGSTIGKDHNNILQPVSANVQSTVLTNGVRTVHSKIEAKENIVPCPNDEALTPESEISITKSDPNSLHSGLTSTEQMHHKPVTDMPSDFVSIHLSNGVLPKLIHDKNGNHIYPTMSGMQIPKPVVEETGTECTGEKELLSENVPSLATSSHRLNTAVGVTRQDTHILPDNSENNMKPRETNRKAKNVDYQSNAFSIISEGYEIMNIHAPPQFSSVDQEESEHMKDKLEYLEDNPIFKTNQLLDRDHADVVPAFKDGANGVADSIRNVDAVNKIKRHEVNVETTAKETLTGDENNFNTIKSAVDIDYFEKYTLVDDQVPIPPELQVSIKGDEVNNNHNGNPSQLTEGSSSFAERFNASTFEDEFYSPDTDIDEAFYGIAQEEVEPRPRTFLNGLGTQNSFDREIKMEVTEDNNDSEFTGTCLFNTEEGVLERSMLFPTTVKLVDPELLEEPPALAFLYTDLYEQATGDRTKEESEHSDTESVNSDRSFPERNSDTDDGPGIYFEKYILKDEVTFNIEGSKKGFKDHYEEEDLKQFIDFYAEHKTRPPTASEDVDDIHNLQQCQMTRQEESSVTQHTVSDVEDFGERVDLLTKDTQSEEPSDILSWETTQSVEHIKIKPHELTQLSDFRDFEASEVVQASNVSELIATGEDLPQDVIELEASETVLPDVAVGLITPEVSLANNATVIITDKDSLPNDTQEIRTDKDSLPNDTREIITDKDSLPNDTREIITDEDSLTNNRQEIITDEVSLPNDTREILTDEDSLPNDTREIITYGGTLPNDATELMDSEVSLQIDATELIASNVALPNDARELITSESALPNDSEELLASEVSQSNDQREVVTSDIAQSLDAEELVICDVTHSNDAGPFKALEINEPGEHVPYGGPLIASCDEDVSVSIPVNITGEMVEAAVFSENKLMAEDTNQQYCHVPNQDITVLRKTDSFEDEAYGQFMLNDTPCVDDLEPVEEESKAVTVDTTGDIISAIRLGEPCLGENLYDHLIKEAQEMEQVSKPPVLNIEEQSDRCMLEGLSRQSQENIDGIVSEKEGLWRKGETSAKGDRESANDHQFPDVIESTETFSAQQDMFQAGETDMAESTERDQVETTERVNTELCEIPTITQMKDDLVEFKAEHVSPEAVSDTICDDVASQSTPALDNFKDQPEIQSHEEETEDLVDYEIITHEELLQDEMSSDYPQDELMLLVDKDFSDHASDGGFEFVNELAQDVTTEQEDSAFEMLEEENVSGECEAKSPESGKAPSPKEPKLPQIDTYCYLCRCAIPAFDKIFGEHKDHEVTTLDNAVIEMTNNLEVVLEKLQESSIKTEDFVTEIETLYNAVEENCSKNEKYLEEQNEEMVKIVEAQHHEKIQRFEEVKKLKMEYLYEQMVSFQQNIDTAKGILEKTVKETEEHEQLVFLNSAQEINNRLLVAMENTLSLEKMPSAFSLFDHYAENSSQSDQKMLKHIAVPHTPKLQPQEPNSATGTSITAYWRVSEEDVIDCFQVYCMEEPQGNRDQSGLIEEYRVTVKESYCILEELEPDKCYNVWVMAVNYTGCSLPSEKFLFRTAPSTPVIKAEDCTVCWDTATIRWTTTYPDAKESFTLECCKQHSPEGEGLRTIAGIKGYEFTICLQPNENYFFYVRAVSNFGSSEQSEAALISTKGTRFHLLGDTAQPPLHVSPEGASVSLAEESLINGIPSILGELLPTRGLHYWEVVVENCSAFRLGVCYKSTPPKSVLDQNPTSWCMYCYSTATSFCYRFLHNETINDIHLTEHPVRIGVLLDYNSGRLLFFNVLRRQLLFTIRHRFTEASHPAFALEAAGEMHLHTGIELPDFAKLS
ncbi:cardiomyopathy-associated protein 5 [Lissotriton helveticus]